MGQTEVKQTGKTTAEAMVGDYVGVMWSGEGELTITTARRTSPRKTRELGRNKHDQAYDKLNSSILKI
jgi:hypothetical protein